VKHSHCTLPERLLVILEVIASQRNAAISIKFCTAKLPETVLTESHGVTLSEFQEFFLSMYQVAGHNSGGRDIGE